MARGQRKTIEEKIAAKQELIEALETRVESEKRELEELYMEKKRKELEAVSDIMAESGLGPEEVAEAFRQLKKAGKVRSFGVSNHNPMQIELLNSCLDEPVCVDQIQFSIAHCPSIDAGLNVNIHNDAGCVREGSVIEYCRLKKIRLQAWSPFQYGMFEGVFIGNEKFPALNKVLDRLAAKYNVTPNAIATAWILRHPAGIQTIVGSVNAGRIREICKAGEAALTREEWYELYLAAGKQLP